MKKSILYVVKPDYTIAMAGLALGAFGCVLFAFAYPRYGLLSALAILVLFRLYIYCTIDMFFTKTIYVQGGELYVKWAGMRFRIDKENGYLMISEITQLGHKRRTLATLNIYRNNMGFYRRLFKNKVKLYESTDDNMILEGRKIATIIGIPFRDVYPMEL